MMKSLFKYCVFVLLFGSFTVVNAQPSQLHPSYVAIKMRTDALDSEPITTTVCGGIVVDEKDNLVATAWHCVPNQRSIIEKPGVFTIGGMDAKLVTFSPESDVAIFQVTSLNGLKAPKFKTPKKGETMKASAFYDAFPVTFSLSDRFIPPMSVEVTLDWEGNVAAVAEASRLGGEHFDKRVQTDFVWVIAKGNPAPGFSGGPVFDKEGNFVGLISNVNGEFTNISSSENIMSIIKGLKL